MKRIAILGSTGSIGMNTLDVVRGLKDIQVAAIAADSNIKLLAEQARLFRPKVISVGTRALMGSLKAYVPSGSKIVCGKDGLSQIVSRPDIDLVLFAISGSSCLMPLMEAIKHRKKIALANKESLVAAGSLVMKLAEEKKVRIIPVDSEHSAIFQCLQAAGGASFLSKIYLTASGGPLLSVDKDRYDKLPRRFILKHPKWRMGRKITVDSATMMNKGLEIIEASHLFGIGEGDIEVLIHPEAIVHSMVEFVDGVILAQLGLPDMRCPIQYALTYPERADAITGRKADFSKIGKLTFFKPDLRKFPCLELAREAIRKGGTYPAVLNAADEEAVKGYLEGRMNFIDIPRVIEKAIAQNRVSAHGELTMGEVLKADGWAREIVRSMWRH